MTKKRTLIALFIAAVLVIFCLWYTRPLSFEELAKGVEPAACQQIKVYAQYETGIDSYDSYELTLRPEDASFSPLLTLFEEQTYRRSLLSLLPRGTWTHSTQPGDFKWEVILSCDAVAAPDGSTGSGDLLRFNNFYGRLEISYLGDTWRASARNLDQWMFQVMEAIQGA